MPRSIVLRLPDIQDAIDGIQEVIAAAAPEAFAKSWGMQRAVERGLEIISEASRHLPADVKALAPDIPAIDPARPCRSVIDDRVP